jgi:hypothetical protein
MKRIKKLLWVAGILVPGLALSQQTYIWNVPAGAWNDPGSWEPARNSIAANDILEFNFSASVTDMPASETVGRIWLHNNASIILNAAASSNILIGNPSVAAPHLLVEQGSELDLEGNNPIVLDIMGGSSGIVDGRIKVAGSAHRLLTNDPASLFFRNGSVFASNSGFTGNAFGSTRLNSVIFQSGSTYHNKAGGNPFGAAQPATVINFQSGSLYIHQVSTAMSLAGRVYGNLEIAANTSYNITLNNDWTILNDLRLNGFNFSFSPIPSNGLVKIQGDIICNGAASLTLGTMTTTNRVELAGAVQHIGSGGGSGSITIQNLWANNEQSILDRPLLVNGVLELRKGRINSSNSSIITLSSTASLLSCDHDYNNLPYLNCGCDQSYIEGPVKWTGISPASIIGIPVGKNGKLRPVFLHNASGDFTIEYFREDPGLISASLATGIDHISGIEYWNISASGSAEIELSFYDPNSGGVSDISALRLARFDGSYWTDEGVSVSSGTAGSNGSVTSNTLTEFGFFSLASASAYPANPLPLVLIDWKAIVKQQAILLKWKTAGIENIYQFALEKSHDGRYFKPFQILRTGNSGHATDYEWSDGNPFDGSNYYRLQVLDADRQVYYSKTIQVNFKYTSGIMVFPNPTRDKLCIKFPAQSSIYGMRIVNSSGSVIRTVPTGSVSTIDLDLRDLPTGIYFIEAWNSWHHIIERFIKF